MKGRKLIFDFSVVSVVPNEIEDIPEGYNICFSYEMADIVSAYKNPLDDDTYQKKFVPHCKESRGSDLLLKMTT